MSIKWQNLVAANSSPWFQSLYCVKSVGYDSHMIILTSLRIFTKYWWREANHPDFVSANRAEQQKFLWHIVWHILIFLFCHTQNKDGLSNIVMTALTSAITGALTHTLQQCLGFPVFPDSFHTIIIYKVASRKLTFSANIDL